MIVLAPQTGPLVQRCVGSTPGLGGPSTGNARGLIDSIPRRDPQTYRRSVIPRVDWAIDSAGGSCVHTLARTHAYKITNNHLLGQAYYNSNADTVDSQLTKGGLRLAKILNDALN